MFKMDRFLCQFIGVLLIIGIVSAYTTPEDEIEIEVCEDFRSFEENFYKAMEQTDQQIRSIKMVSSPHAALGLIPEIGGTAKGAVSTIIYSEMNKEWRRSLHKEIVSAISRSNAKQALATIKTCLRTISQQFNQLRTQQLKDEDVKTKVHIIHNKFLEILNLYSDQNIIFRKHPQLTVTPFASITILFKIFEAIREKFIPNLDTRALACRLQDQIEEYRNLHVFYRLQSIEITNDFAQGSEKSNAIEVRERANVEAMELSYDSKGYTKTSSRGFLSLFHFQKPSITCGKGACNRWNDNERCLKDQDTFYRYSVKDDCPETFSRLLRHRIEMVYDNSSHALNDICTDTVRKQRKATGYGWLTIIFLRAHGKYLSTGSVCDPFIFSGTTFTQCDLYVGLRINGQYEFITAARTGQDVVFYEIYQSRKISKHQSVEIGLRDEDSGDDDELGTWNGHIEDLINPTVRKLEFGDNFASMVVHWRDEFTDEL